MNAHNILIYTFCLFGMILIQESDGKSCERNGDKGFQLKSVGDTKTWNFVRNWKNLTQIRLRLRSNPTTWFFKATRPLTSETGQLYCCHENVTYYMVVNTNNGVELSASRKEKDGWNISYVQKPGRRIFQHKSTELYLTVKEKRLHLSNLAKHAMFM